MPVKVTETQRGPSVLLSYAFIYIDTDKELVSEKIVINNLVAVSAKLQPSGDLCFLSYTKINTEDNVQIVLRITCENPSYDDKLICTEDESNWLKIGKTGYTSVGTNGTKTYMNSIQINISARKIEKSQLCTNMYLDADFTDFSLSAANGSVAMHKIVMASHSDVFKAMLHGEWKENIEGRVEVKGSTRQCLDHLKDYMYLDILPDEGLCPLLLLASFYMIQNLKTRCIGKLADSVTSENLYELLDFACLNNIPELTYEILHITPSQIVDKAYKSKMETKTPKAEGDGSDN